MSLTTRVAAASDALAEILRARTGVTCEVTVGAPVVPKARHIWIEESIVRWTQEQGTTGDMSTAVRDEEFALPLLVAVKQTGDEFGPVRDAALELAGEVEKAVRDNHTLNGTVSWCEVRPSGLDGGRSGTERICVVALDVNCTAYLS